MVVLRFQGPSAAVRFTASSLVFALYFSQALLPGLYFKGHFTSVDYTYYLVVKPLFLFALSIDCGAAKSGPIFRYWCEDSLRATL